MKHCIVPDCEFLGDLYFRVTSIDARPHRLISKSTCEMEPWVSEGLKTRAHDPFLRIRFLLVPKNGSCEHIKNDLPSNGSVILKKRMEIEHALFSSDTLLER